MNSKKNNILNVVFVVSFLLINFFVIGQQISVSEALTNESLILIEDSSEQALDENVMLFNSKNNTNLGPLFKVVLVLILLVVGIYAFFHFIKKADKSSVTVDSYIKNPSNYYFSPNKSVQIILVGDRAFLIGVTDQTINLISELNDKELIDSLKLESGKTQHTAGTSFLSIFNKIMPSQKNTTTATQDTFGFDSFDATELKKHRDRFNSNKGTNNEQ